MPVEDSQVIRLPLPLLAPIVCGLGRLLLKSGIRRRGSRWSSLFCARSAGMSEFSPRLRTHIEGVERPVGPFLGYHLRHLRPLLLPRIRGVAIREIITQHFGDKFRKVPVFNQLSINTALFGFLGGFYQVNPSSNLGAAFD